MKAPVPRHPTPYDTTMTSSQPSNESELQLFRVLQRANLLQYFDTFISQGGDDVQQLCEAGEEEFLEIMALVGMASKPLHVRRLQKALQEWIANPGIFTQSLHPGSTPAPGSIAAAVHGNPPSGFSPNQAPQTPSSYVSTNKSAGPQQGIAPTQPQTSSSVQAWSPGMERSSTPGTHPPVSQSAQQPSPLPQAPPISVSPGLVTQSGNTSVSDNGGPPPLEVAPGMVESPKAGSSHDSEERLTDSPVPTPVLVEGQIRAISDAAIQLINTLPPCEPKPLNMKKPINRDIELDFDDPQNMDELRKYAAIYGRFDSKRKNDKPMSMHEISVNEAAAQLCRRQPALLTRREDLFPLARQVVRNSGYQYSKGHSRAQNLDNPIASKRAKLESIFSKQDSKALRVEIEQIKREERMADINQEIEQIKGHQEEITSRIQEAKVDENYALVQNLQGELETLKNKQLQLMTEQSDIIRKQRKCDRLIIKMKSGSCSGADDDSADSLVIASGSSSPQNGPSDKDNEFSNMLSLYASGKMLKPNSLQSRKLVQETLYDEGLRIAQEYGLADLAEEIRGMKKEDGDDDDNTTGSIPPESGNENSNPQLEWGPSRESSQNVNGQGSDLPVGQTMLTSSQNILTSNQNMLTSSQTMNGNLSDFVKVENVNIGS